MTKEDNDNERLETSRKGDNQSLPCDTETNPQQLDEAELRKRYLAQLRQQSCPGCGEGDPIF